MALKLWFTDHQQKTCRAAFYTRGSPTSKVSRLSLAVRTTNIRSILSDAYYPLKSECSHATRLDIPGCAGKNSLDKTKNTKKDRLAV